jgi:tetraacyldisaccharide 4'-kinase
MGAYLYSFNLIAFLLLPLSAVYWVLQRLHRFLYAAGLLRTHQLPVPVIVVGNVTVGGTGKTPLVAWLCAHLESKGYHPGVISRGYRGKKSEPVRVSPDANPEIYGDEPVLLANKTGVPVYTSANRVEAAKKLLEENQCNVIISDDGLQHYRLERDIEIVVIDGWWRFGNGFLLPAGPLRESKKRLTKVDWVLCRGGQPEAGELTYNYSITGLYNLETGQEYNSQQLLGQLAGKQVHAIAGIGNPDQFFGELTRSGFDIVRHPFTDHHDYREQDLLFSDGLPIIMTEKDAVKCKKLVGKLKCDAWYLAIEAKLPEAFGEDIVKKLGEVKKHG